jgi:hypothetical protein
MMVRQRRIPKSGNRFSDKIMRRRSGNDGVAWTLAEITEIAINPLMAHMKREDATALGALIVVGP